MAKIIPRLKSTNEKAKNLYKIYAKLEPNQLIGY